MLRIRAVTVNNAAKQFHANWRWGKILNLFTWNWFSRISQTPARSRSPSVKVPVWCHNNTLSKSVTHYTLRTGPDNTRGCLNSPKKSNPVTLNRINCLNSFAIPQGYNLSKAAYLHHLSYFRSSCSSMRTPHSCWRDQPWSLTQGGCEIQLSDHPKLVERVTKMIITSSSFHHFAFNVRSHQNDHDIVFLSSFSLGEVTETILASDHHHV